MLHDSCIRRNAQTVPVVLSFCWFVSLTAYSERPFGWTTRKDGLVTPANEPRTPSSPVMPLPINRAFMYVPSMTQQESWACVVRLLASPTHPFWLSTRTGARYTQ